MEHGRTKIYPGMALDWIEAEGLDLEKVYRKNTIVEVDKSEWKLLNKYPAEVMEAICERKGASPEYLQRIQESEQAWSYVTQQGNGYDCGVCTCMNADFAADDIPLVGMYSNEDLPRLRTKIAADILRGAVIYTE